MLQTFPHQTILITKINHHRKQQYKKFSDKNIMLTTPKPAPGLAKPCQVSFQIEE